MSDVRCHMWDATCQLPNVRCQMWDGDDTWSRLFLSTRGQGCKGKKESCRGVWPVYYVVSACFSTPKLTSVLVLKLFRIHVFDACATTSGSTVWPDKLEVWWSDNPCHCKLSPCMVLVCDLLALKLLRSASLGHVRNPDWKKRLNCNNQCNGSGSQSCQRVGRPSYGSWNLRTLWEMQCLGGNQKCVRFLFVDFCMRVLCFLRPNVPLVHPSSTGNWQLTSPSPNRRCESWCSHIHLQPSHYKSFRISWNWQLRQFVVSNLNHV